MNCEICGADKGPFYQVIFLGDRVIACHKCVKKHGLTVVKKHGVEPLHRVVGARINTNKRKLIKSSSNIDEYDLIENYGSVIKRARERLGWTQEELAKKLRVKLSYIKKVEANKLVPEPNIARKIEKLLNVKILDAGKDASQEVEIYSEEEMEYTLGDLINLNSRDIEGEV